MTWTEETTSIGRLIACPPVAGSVTFAEFTSQPACVACAPFMLMRPSGPRTTPGTRGRRLSILSLSLGAFSTVDWVIVLVWADFSIGGGSLAVTVTELVTVATLRSIGTTEVVPGFTSTGRAAFKPGAVASMSYIPGGRPSTANAPFASDSVSLVVGP